jgi:GR25 family glycosyltransferase involved in LPS biosynthesis
VVRSEDAARIVSAAALVTDGLSRQKTLALWRTLIARFPGQPAYARQYVRELQLSEGWSEMDDFAERASRYGDAGLDLQYLDTALARLDIETADRLLSDFSRKHGSSTEYDHRAYVRHFLAKDFDLAANLASKMAATPTGANNELKRARYYSRMKSRLDRTAETQTDYDVFVINLDSDTQRLRRVETQLGSIAWTRVPGVKGTYLPDYLLRLASRGYAQRLKGTAGCFLSHIVAWEQIVTRGKSALVLEDDANIIAGLPPSLRAIGIPDHSQFVFVNERMLPEGFRHPTKGFGLMTVKEVVRTKRIDWTSAGTDGYVVSPAGAKTLLSMVRRDGIGGDVDWRLISYSLTKSERARLIARGGFVGRALEFHEQFRSSSRRLAASVLLPSLVRQFAGGSVRLWDNDLPAAHLATLKSLLVARR